MSATLDRWWEHPSDLDLTALSEDCLRQRCRLRGLKTTGDKLKLVARLELWRNGVSDARLDRYAARYQAKLQPSASVAIRTVKTPERSRSPPPRSVRALIKRRPGSPQTASATHRAVEDTCSRLVAPTDATDSADDRNGDGASSVATPGLDSDSQVEAPRFKAVEGGPASFQDRAAMPPGRLTEKASGGAIAAQREQAGAEPRDQPMNWTLAADELPTPSRKRGTSRKSWVLSPPRPASSSLAPLFGGVEELAAQCADTQQVSDNERRPEPMQSTEVDEEQGRPASSLFAEAHETATSSNATDIAAAGELPRTTKPTVTQYCRPSKAAQALVALSIRAAEEDELAVEPRLVDLCTGMVHALPNDGVVSIGQCTDCDIIVAFPMVDHRHCVLLCSNGCAEVEDVGSKGTFVNEMLVPKGDFLPQRVPLRRGDTLTLSNPDGPKFLFLDGRLSSTDRPRSGSGLSG